MSMLQIYKDEEEGFIRFRDKNQQTPSVKCKPSDIDIIDKLDRSIRARLRRDISAEINAHRLPAVSK